MVLFCVLMLCLVGLFCLTICLFEHLKKELATLWQVVLEHHEEELSAKAYLADQIRRRGRD